MDSNLENFNGRIFIGGTIVNKPVIKSTKDGTDMTFLKLNVINERGTEFYVKIKVFGDSAKEVIERYVQDDIIDVLGVGELVHYPVKGGICTEFDVYPIKITKKGHKNCGHNGKIELR